MASHLTHKSHSTFKLKLLLSAPFLFVLFAGFSGVDGLVVSRTCSEYHKQRQADLNQSLAPSRGSAKSSTSATSTSAAKWFQPTPGTTFLWSLQAAIPTKPTGKKSLDLSKMQVYDVDLFDSTKSQIATYKKAGKKVVCYFSAGSWEDWRDDAEDFTPACYCNQKSSCKMTGWDEYWLDLRSASCISNVQSIMKKRIELAKAKGCDAVEPDNTDSYMNKPGWKTTIDDQFNYLKFLSTTAHANNLGIALKNGPDMIKKRPTIVDITDFVLIEECAAYNECSAYQPFVKAGKAAFEVEYERGIACSKTLPGFFALSYSSYDVDYKNVAAFCPKS